MAGQDGSQPRRAAARQHRGPTDDRTAGRVKLAEGLPDHVDHVRPVAEAEHGRVVGEEQQQQASVYLQLLANRRGIAAAPAGIPGAGEDVARCVEGHPEKRGAQCHQVTEDPVAG